MFPATDAEWTTSWVLISVVSPRMQIVGYTIGNDMSARDIEGENPLYLPQAKVYDGSCALGPVITLAGDLPPREQVAIRLTITRAGAVAFTGSTSLAALVRTFADLVAWLGRENSFPDGVILLTGTGIVPPDDFTLAIGDEVAIVELARRERVKLDHARRPSGRHRPVRAAGAQGGGVPQRSAPVG